MNLSQSLILLALSANAGSAVAAQTSNSELNKEPQIEQTFDLSFHLDPILGETRQAGVKWMEPAVVDGE